MKLKALALALVAAGLATSYALAAGGPPPGKGNAKQATTTAAATSGDKKVTVCHRAGNSGKYVKLKVSKNAVKGHMKHHDVMPDASGACPAAAPKTADGGTTSTAATTTTTTSTTTTTATSSTSP